MHIMFILKITAKSNCHIYPTLSLALLGVWRGRDKKGQPRNTCLLVQLQLHHQQFDLSVEKGLKGSKVMRRCERCKTYVFFFFFKFYLELRSNHD